MDIKRLRDKGWTDEQIYWVRKFKGIIEHSQLPLTPLRIVREDKNPYDLAVLRMTYILPNDAGGFQVVVDYPRNENQEAYFEHLMGVSIEKMRNILANKPTE
jgi:hypothetical protein